MPSWRLSLSICLKFLPACLGPVEGGEKSLAPISCFYWVCYYWKNPTTSVPASADTEELHPCLFPRNKTQANLLLQPSSASCSTERRGWGGNGTTISDLTQPHQQWSSVCSLRRTLGRVLWTELSQSCSRRGAYLVGNTGGGQGNSDIVAGEKRCVCVWGGSLGG